MYSAIINTSTNTRTGVITLWGTSSFKGLNLETDDNKFYICLFICVINGPIRCFWGSSVKLTSVTLIDVQKCNFWGFEIILPEYFTFRPTYFKSGQLGLLNEKNTASLYARV